MQSQERFAAVAGLGFTDRQARFLALVMQHSGVCLLRQYTAFAGIVHGQKTRNFFTKLVSRRFATAYACRHNRGHVYHVHHKALYRAIGETDSRHRRPLSPDRIIHGLATVDAVLATPAIEYLATVDERRRRLSIEAHFFKDKHPVGVDPDGRFVLLYVATEACSHRFVAFLHRQQALLRSMPAWTLRIVVPSWPVRLDETYLKVADTELSQVLSPKHVDVLRRYFEERRAAPTADARARSADFYRARRAFRGERFEVLYRRWLTEGDAVLEAASSADLGQALKVGTGRIESVVLSHQYRHLSLLVALEDRTTGAEKREMAASAPRLPLPWPRKSSRKAFRRRRWRAKHFHSEHLRRRLWIRRRGDLCRASVRAGHRPASETGRERPRHGAAEATQARPRGRSRPAVFVRWSRACRRDIAPRIDARSERKCARHCVCGLRCRSMVVLRCTHKLLVRLKQTEVPVGVESTTRLGDWYGNILRIGRRQHLIFISERSRLPIVIPIREVKRLETVFPDAVCDVLAAVGIAAEDIADERSRMCEIAFGRTNNRSLLGTLNDFAFMARQGNAQAAEPESPGELMRFLAQTPILPLDGANPIALTRAAFES